ncbi:hypothetical protein SISNIDRAFT_164449 [Sistotremastrum niveocremeum HHB9708]|uniref:Uncharacterized protein n=1 Tax=Sistotremastrum niveocremeum HHB9708 TaxID=1314777 RepID=A0A164SFZ9_9AGAM|nr:hypothetical protein SISNIDRAFT_164449 [Sistotremastrum niveocremeum HHB9708]
MSSATSLSLLSLSLAAEQSQPLPAPQSNISTPDISTSASRVKPRRLSSASQMRRRMSDAREATIRPAYAFIRHIYPYTMFMMVIGSRRAPCLGSAAPQQPSPCPLSSLSMLDPPTTHDPKTPSHRRPQLPMPTIFHRVCQLLCLLPMSVR